MDSTTSRNDFRVEVTSTRTDWWERICSQSNDTTGEIRINNVYSDGLSYNILCTEINEYRTGTVILLSMDFYPNNK